MNFRFWYGVMGAVPFGAVTSQTLLDVMISLLFLAWIFIYWRADSKSSHRISWTGIEWAFIGYLMVIIAGFIFSASPEAEVTWSLKKFVWLPHFYIFIYALKQLRLDRLTLLKYFSIVFLLPNIYALICYLLGYDIVTGIVNERVIGLVSSATYHAHANGIVFVFFSAFLFLSYQHLSRNMKIMTVLAYTIFALSVFLTFTRGIWAAILVSTILMYTLFSYRLSVKILIGAGAVAAISFFTWPQFNERIQHSLSIEKNHERADLFMVNYQMFFEHPFLGIGYDENKRRVREYWDRIGMPDDYIISHAHNQFVNVLSTTGLLGLLFFLYIFSFFLKTNWQLIKNTSRTLTPVRHMFLFACMWAQLEFILGCLTDVSFEYAKIRELILIVWALVIAIKLKPEIIVEDGVKINVA